MTIAPVPVTYAELLEDLKPVLAPALSVVYAAAPGTPTAFRPGRHGLAVVPLRAAS